MPDWGPMTGKEQTAKKVPAPRLRFPGFVGEWEEKKLGEVLTIANGRDYKHLKPGNIPVYGTGGYMLSVNEHLHEGESVTIGRKGTIDKPDMLTGKFWAVDTLFYTHSYRNTTARFILYVFQQINWRDYNSASGVPSLTKSTIDEIEIPFPSLPEQTRIAAALSSLDTVIAAHQSKQDALRQHKRGLMAGLFPSEGERVPRLRFPEFEGAGEWEEKKLGEVATFINGRAYSKDELLAQGKYKVLRVGNFFSNNHWYYSNLELEEAKYCDPGDLLYAWSASFGPRIWREQRAIYHYHIWKVVTRHNNNPTFLFHLLDKITDEMKASLKNGLGIFHITKSGIENWTVLFPPSLPEQTRIAACLSSLDSLIAAQGDHIAALQAFKRGLMQGLFPAASADNHTTQEAAE